MFRILFIGDIVGSTGRRALKDSLGQIVQQHKPDMIIANGENIASGKGITRTLANELYGLGIHCITLGNHTWDQKEIFDFIDDERRIIRPANFPNGVPGRGYVEINIKGESIAVINLQGRTFLPPIDCPFQKANHILEKINAKHIIVDFHAEATSEKIAMGWHLDGRVSAVLGTHTHVQTNDARILSAGTAYITDVGMTGSHEGVLGVNKQVILQKFLTQLPARFTVDEGKYQINAVVIDLQSNGKASKITPIMIYE
jgi:metallophosphoesterase (TIGR00282 family)